MTKRLIAVGFCLLLLCSLPVFAAADELYPAPEPVEAGCYFEHRLASLSADGAAALAEGALPAGVELVGENTEQGLDIWLRGTPSAAGVYNFIVDLNGSRTMFVLTVLPAAPIVDGGGTLECSVGDTVTLQVSAHNADGGAMSYQWFRAADASGSGAVVVQGATGSSLTISPDREGSSWYYCSVSNSSAGMTATTQSGIFTVAVEMLKLSGLDVRQLPLRLEYTVGERVDGTGLVLNAVMTDATVRKVTDGYTLSPEFLQTVGEQTVTVSYHSLSTSFSVRVNEDEANIKGIGVLTLPDKTAYLVGESLAPEGLSIRVYTASGHHDVSEGLVCSPPLFKNAGEQTVTVEYCGRTCTFAVSVAARGEESLSVLQLPDKKVYLRGDTLETAGLVLKHVAADGAETELREGIRCEPMQLDTPGEQTIRATVGELSCSFTVTVLAEPEPSAAPSAQPSPQPSALPAPTAAPAPPEPAHSLRGFVSWIAAAAAIAALAVLISWLLLTRQDRIGDWLDRRSERRNRR